MRLGLCLLFALALAGCDRLQGPRLVLPTPARVGQTATTPTGSPSAPSGGTAQGTVAATPVALQAATVAATRPANATVSASGVATVGTPSATRAVNVTAAPPGGGTAGAPAATGPASAAPSGTPAGTATAAPAAPAQPVGTVPPTLPVAGATGAPPTAEAAATAAATPAPMAETATPPTPPTVVAAAPPAAPPSAGPPASATRPPRLILYVQNEALWAASFDGAPPRQLSPDGFYPQPTDLLDAPPALTSPDTRWVIGTSPKSEQGTWLFSTDGATQRQLKPQRVAATWAPNSQGYTWADQNAVYVSLLASGATPLEVARVDKPAEILPQAIVWADSGDQIAFQVKEGGETTLRTVSAAGGAAKTLSRVADTDSLPDALTWAPNGQAILWSLPRPARIVYPDGRAAVDMPADVARVFAFSPDSQRLLLTWKAGDTYQLGTTDLSGQARQPLASSKGDFGFAAWAPDGQRGAYVTLPEGGPAGPDANQLWVVEAGGANARRLGEGTDLAPFSVEWLTNTALLVASGDKPPEVSLRRVDAASGGIQPLVRNVSWFFAVAPRR